MVMDGISDDMLIVSNGGGTRKLARGSQPRRAYAV